MPSPCTSLRRARPLLGTLVEVTARGEAARLPRAIEAAYSALALVQRLMSAHDPASDVSRLNRLGGRSPVTVDPRTYAVLAHAAEVSSASDGAFDVTVGPRLVQWGYLPDDGRPLPAVRRGGHRAIELLAGHRVRLHEPLLLDLGGIAKGYAVDLACEALEQCGITDYVVNAGGDLRVGSRRVTVQVRHPARPNETLALATLCSAAIATSARYFAERPGPAGTVHPIVAPATGAPAEYHGSVSVRARSCMTADALTKVVAVLGPAAPPVLDRFAAEAIELTVTGEWRALATHTPIRRAAG